MELQELYEQYPLPNEQLQTFLKSRPENTLFSTELTSVERISMRFETIAVRQALIDVGVSAEIATQIAEKNLERQSSAKEFLDFITHCQEQGVDPDTLAATLPVIKEILKTYKREDLLEEKHVREHFDGRFIGYDYPLTESQLIEWTHKEPSPIPVVA